LKLDPRLPQPQHIALVIASLFISHLAASVAALVAGCLLVRIRVNAAVRARLECRAAELEAMLDAIPMPVWRRTADFTLVACNRAYAAALGAGREQVLAEGRELIPGGGQKAARARIEATSSATECRVRFHVVIDGSRRLLELVEAPIASSGTVGYAIDCTEAEAAREELWRHIGAHGEVLEGIHAGIAIFGADRSLKFFNAAFAALWGLPEKWLASGPAFDEVLEWLRERRRLPEVADFRAFKRERLAWFTNLIEPRQELLHRSDGRTLSLSVSPHPLGGLTFAYEDVTDHLALESSYNTLAQVQRATLDHLFEGVAVFGGDGRLKLHNPAYRTIWDLMPDDLVGEPHISQIVEKTRALLGDDGDWLAKKAAIVADVTARAASCRPLYRSDGSLLQQAAVPLPDGEVLLSYLDVSDTARVERALRDKAEALETAGRLKSEFVTSLSHELRTPLNAVAGFAEILAKQYFGPLNPRQLDYVHGILDSAQQLTDLADDIFDLATIEAGHIVLERAAVDIAALLQSVTGLTRERARLRGLRLSLSCPPDLGSIEADPRRLKQALFNLISNAIKFTAPGGTITVAAERRGGELLLSVTDSGTGAPLPPGENKFAELTSKIPPAGAGVGLALVRNLVELHGGAVAVQSVPPRGVRITCRLPAAAQPLISATLATAAYVAGDG
jgi:signal transduction histidine kinase